MYYTKSAIISLTSATDIMDAGDNVIAHLERELFSFTEKYYITMADGRKFTMTNELFHIVDDITNIEELGWQLQGNFVGLNFNLRDEFGEPIATIGKKMISLHDKYCIDLYKTEQEPVVVAILIVLEKMMQAQPATRTRSLAFSTFVISSIIIISPSLNALFCSGIFKCLIQFRVRGVQRVFCVPEQFPVPFYFAHQGVDPFMTVECLPLYPLYGNGTVVGTGLFPDRHDYVCLGNRHTVNQDVRSGIVDSFLFQQFQQGFPV